MEYVKSMSLYVNVVTISLRPCINSLTEINDNVIHVVENQHLKTNATL